MRRWSEGTGVGFGHLLWTFVLTCAVHGGAAAAQGDVQAVTLAHASEFTLHSAATGRDYLIQVAEPQGSPPAGGYPVLYVLDGNAYWPMVRLAHRMFSRHGPYGKPTPLLIVGVGYPGVERFDFDARAQDYTPAAPEHADNRRRGQRSYGGAARFLEFIEQQLKPAIGARYPVDEGAQSIVGHSFGGLFALYTLLHKPDAFHFYGAISPSLWWGEGYISRALDGATSGTELDGRCLLIGVGQLEQTPRRDKQGTARAKLVRERHMVGSARRLARRLQRLYPRLQQELAVFAGERHGTVIWPAVRRVLAYLDHCETALRQKQEP